MSAPRISVIIPCFNLGAYLDEAVDSVFGQTFQDFEILIVDDGSTDPETRRLLSGYRRPRTAVFRTENRGLAAARNFLIQRARGEYLCALDADDKLHPRYFERAIARFDEDPSLTFVSTWLETFGEEQWVWRHERCDLAALLAEDTVMTAALVRRQAVLAVGGYDERMPAQGDEDWDLWISLVKGGYRGVIIPETLFYYRRRPGSMSTVCAGGQTHLDLVQYLVRKHRDAYPEHLLDVLLWKEGYISDLRRANVRLEHDVETRLRPEVERRRAEVERLERRLAQARAGAIAGAVGPGAAAGPDADGELRRLRDEVAALRASRSWRLTAPLRAGYELVRRAARQGGRA